MAVVPVLVAPALRRVLDALPAATGVAFTDFGAVVRLPGMAGSIAPGVIAAALLVAVLAAVALSRWRSRRRPGAASAAAVGLWRRRADGPDAVHRNIIRRTAAAGVRRRAAPGHRHRGHATTRNRGTWSKPSRYRSRIGDAIEERLYTPVVDAVAAAAGQLRRRAHTGSVHLYLALRRARCADRAGGRQMNVMSYVAGAAQIGTVMIGAPLVIGADAAGAGTVGGPRRRRDAAAVARSAQTAWQTTDHTRRAPRWCSPPRPAMLAGTTLLIAAIAPLVATGSPLDASADLFAVVGLLFLGTVALTLAGIDTGTSFGGMGASREITIAALVEPTILLAVFALSIPAGSANLGALVANTIDHPGQVASLAGVLAFVALVIVIIAETGRLPVDNPATHLELTMVHEAMVLEYAGPRLALVEWASAMRLTVLLALLANLFLPWGIAGARARPRSTS